MVRASKKEKVGGALNSPRRWANLGLDEALVQHRIGNFQEATNVGSVYEVAGRTILFGCFVAGLVAADHYLVESFVDFFTCPAQS